GCRAGPQKSGRSPEVQGDVKRTDQHRPRSAGDAGAGDSERPSRALLAVQSVRREDRKGIAQVGSGWEAGKSAAMAVWGTLHGKGDRRRSTRPRTAISPRWNLKWISSWTSTIRSRSTHHWAT